MVQLYILEQTAADWRAQQLTDAHTARLLRQGRTYQSPIAHLQAWWKQAASITHRPAPQPSPYRANHIHSTKEGHTMNRFMLLALFALTLIAGSFGAVAAAPRASTGAFVIDDAIAHEEPDGSVWYLTVKGVSSETLTPEGNRIYVGNAKTTHTLYDPDGTLVMSAAGKQHSLRLITEPVSGDIDGEQPFRIVSDRFSSTITLADGTVCSYSYRLHMVDGVIKFFDVDFPCAQ